MCMFAAFALLFAAATPLPCSAPQPAVPSGCTSVVMVNDSLAGCVWRALPPTCPQPTTQDSAPPTDPPTHPRPVIHPGISITGTPAVEAIEYLRRLGNVAAAISYETAGGDSGNLMPHVMLVRVEMPVAAGANTEARRASETAVKQEGCTYVRLFAACVQMLPRNSGGLR